jgi:hypothetical protein
MPGPSLRRLAVLAAATGLLRLAHDAHYGFAALNFG